MWVWVTFLPLWIVISVPGIGNSRPARRPISDSPTAHLVGPPPMCSLSTV